MSIRNIALVAFASAAFVSTATPALAQSAAQAAYEAQMRAYERQQQEYRQARDAYDADIRRYQSDSEVYYDPGIYTPAAYVPFESLTPINSQVLINKSVQTLDGEYVGKVTNIRLAGNMVTQMEVHINPARVTWVNTSRMRYDEVGDVVVTDLTAEQMANRSRLDF